MSKRILIISTHPDDEVLSFGGLMSKSQWNGDKIWLHTFCVGGPCSNVPRITREFELYSVAKFFDLHRLTYEDDMYDGVLDTIPSCILTGKIDSMIKEFEPDEVYCTPMSEHSDHIATIEAFKASARLKSGYIPKLFAIGTYQFSDQLYQSPDGGKIFNPLSEDDFNRKCEAFLLHESQQKPEPSPLGIDGLTTLNRYHGLMCGHKYAELYYQLRYIRTL